MIINLSSQTCKSLNPRLKGDFQLLRRMKNSEEKSNYFKNKNWPKITAGQMASQKTDA